MTGGDKSELARGGGIEQPGCEHAVVHQGHALGRNTFGVERARTQAARAVRVIDHLDARPEQPLPELFFEETRLARDRGAVDRAGEMADERSRYPPVEYDRDALGLHFARVEPFDRALARRAPDLVRRVEIGAMHR